MPVDPTVVRDLVIVVPGIMGSALVDSRGHTVWDVGPGLLANAIRTLGKSLKRLQLPAGIGDGPAVDGVRATSLLNSLHVVPGLWSPITGYDGLLGFLRSRRFHLVEAQPGNSGIVPNLVPFPYDWRLSNRYNGRRLAEFAVAALEQWRKQPGMADAKLVLVCHSMGGLVARWFAEQEGGSELIRALITIGTPFRGAFKAATMLVNGLEPGIGPLRLSLTDFARSLPSLYQLLPQYDCLSAETGRTSLAAGSCPVLDAAMLRDANAFHQALAASAEPAYALHKIVGIRQPTQTTGRVAGDRVVPTFEIDERNQGGDGTVPRLSAEPVAGRGREVHEVADQHGQLQGARSFLDLLDGILSREEIIWQDAGAAEGFGVDMADVWSTLDEPELRVTDMNDRRLLVSLQDETGRVVEAPVPVRPEGLVRFRQLPEGGYRAVVASQRPGGPSPVTKPIVVLDPDLPV